MDVYAGSCNPPRRAKRLRSDSGPPLPPQQDTIPVSSPSSPSHPDDDDHDDPQHQHLPPKRRGRRPGTLSRAAREAQRKVNHSLIEKARRTKINDALATLRDLVPPEYKRPPDNQPDDSDDDELDSKKPTTKPKPSGEKEFKLEILVRTVAYLQDLTEKVNGCPRCSDSISISPDDGASRQRLADDVHSHHDVAASRSSSVAPPSRLPSISTWLPSSAEDQRSLLTPSHSPAFDPTAGARSTQLPTPPTSALCAPATSGFPIPPVLTLPSPSTFIPPATTTYMQPRFSGFTPRANPKASPVASPVYTPEDETAASLLLRMSTTSPRTVSKTPVRPVEADTRRTLSTGNVKYDILFLFISLQNTPTSFEYAGCTLTKDCVIAYPDPHITSEQGETFLDHVIIHLRGGRGGNGCVAFHREKFKAMGPPSGGNGGRGGDVYVMPTPELTTLSSIQKRVRGLPGNHGRGTWQNGRNAAPTVIKVPLGTVVRELPRDDPRRAKDEWEAEEEALEALGSEARRAKMLESRWVHYPRSEDDNLQRDVFKQAEAALWREERERRWARMQRANHPLHLDLSEVEHVVQDVNAPLALGKTEYLGHLIARGGGGGMGNPYFLAPVNRSPKFATRGHDGERVTLELELKIIADVGFVGMPNAGKSTLLRALTGGRAKTEVASYAFTTLNPVVGVIRVADDGTFEGELQDVHVFEETAVEEAHRLKQMAADAESAPEVTEETPEPSFESSTAHVTNVTTLDQFAILESFRFTIADNPGLISRASEDVGLGHSFLRSIERSHALVYVVDLARPAPWDDLEILREELDKYKPGMSDKARLVIANKADLLASDGDAHAVSEAREKLCRLEAYVETKMAVDGSGTRRQMDVVPISAKFGQNLKRVVGLMQGYIKEAREVD
ncbi:hypothetical protein J3R82DRAFT_8156 [Butyriboletus roseoflavus]|nr:hypothetical protein J3R82DRAFT_8156 [Butyriboletus roseoflavus]